MNNHTHYAKTSPAGVKNFGEVRLQRRPPMKSNFVWAMPVAALFFMGNGSGAFADTSDVKGPAPGDRRGALSRQGTVHRYSQRAAKVHCLIRKPRPGLPDGFCGTPLLPRSPDIGGAPRLTPHTCRRTERNCPGAPRITGLFRSN